MSSLQIEIYKFLKERLSPVRLEHSVNTGKLAAQLASIYGQDPVLADLAGLIHDIDKETDLLVMQQTLNGQNGMIEEIFQNGMYLHGPSGAIVAKKQFGIKEQLVLDAVKSHTGLYHLTEAEPLSLILCIADYGCNLHPLPLKERVIGLAFAGKIEPAMQLWCLSVMRYYRLKGIQIHPNLNLSWSHFGRLIGYNR